MATHFRVLKPGVELWYYSLNTKELDTPSDATLGFDRLFHTAATEWGICSNVFCASERSNFSISRKQKKEALLGMYFIFYGGFLLLHDMFRKFIFLSLLNLIMLPVPHVYACYEFNFSGICQQVLYTPNLTDYQLQTINIVF